MQQYQWLPGNSAAGLIWGLQLTPRAELPLHNKF